jgi:hypothetical protein
MKTSKPIIPNTLLLEASIYGCNSLMLVVQPHPEISSEERGVGKYLFDA